MYCHKAAETVREKEGQQGFTLIEVLMAMAIFSLGMMAVGAMQITSTNSNASARIHTEEYTWVVDQIERMTALEYEHVDLDPGDHSVVQGPYTVDWTVVDNTTVTGAKRITVTADGPHRQARPITIDFIKAR